MWDCKGPEVQVASPLPHASFFWGCMNYSRGDACWHDRAVACHGSLQAVIAAPIDHIYAADLSVNAKHIDNKLQKFRSKELQDIDDAKKLYECVADGSAPNTIEVCGILTI